MTQALLLFSRSGVPRIWEVRGLFKCHGERGSVTGEILQSFFWVFSGAAVLATLALYTRQPILVAYIGLGAILGPSGVAWVTDVSLLGEMASVGIIFLLFLLGLELQPAALLAVLGKALGVTLVSGAVFFAVGAALAHLSGLGWQDSFVLGMAVMNSSTIIGIKLLPTTVLHHRHAGELMIGLLLVQDLIALFSLLVLNGWSHGQAGGVHLFWQMLAALPGLVLLAYAGVRFILVPLLTRFDRFTEYVFLLAIGWCLGISACAHSAGLSYETGAFIAGVTLAVSPISQYIALSLKPLRDFFLVLFFFALGARMNWLGVPALWLPILLLSLLAVVGKPVIYRFLLGHASETADLSWDIGFRLGQISEFGFLIAYLAESQGLLSARASTALQAAAVLTFLISTYIVIFNFPNPIAVREELRRD